MKQARPSGRRRSREFAVQALYQWQIAGQELPALLAQYREAEDFDKADATFFTALLQGAIAHADATRAAVAPHLDRPWAEMSPVERAVLLLAGFELAELADVPYRVVINEAIELAKSYGGTDGHKYINGVLDKLAASTRGAEIAHGGGRAAKQARGTT